MHNLPTINIPYHSGALVIIGEPTLIHYHHPKFTSLHCCFEKCVSILILPQNIFTDLKVLCAPHTYSSLPLLQPLTTTDISTVSKVSLFQNVIKLELYSIQSFQICFFHLVICISVSSMSFQNLIVRFLLLFSNIPLSGGSTVYLSIHLLKDVLVASKFWKI